MHLLDVRGEKLKQCASRARGTGWRLGVSSRRNVIGVGDSKIRLRDLELAAPSRQPCPIADGLHQGPPRCGHTNVADTHACGAVPGMFTSAGGGGARQASTERRERPFDCFLPIRTAMSKYQPRGVVRNCHVTVTNSALESVDDGRPIMMRSLVVWGHPEVAQLPVLSTGGC